MKLRTVLCLLMLATIVALALTNSLSSSGAEEADSKIAMQSLVSEPLTGSLTNGFTHTGVLQVGGLDTWTIPAAFNDSITVRVGEVTGSGPAPNFFPRVRIIRPDGATLGDDFGSTNDAEVSARAPVAGTGVYTILVSQHPNITQVTPEAIFSR